MFTGIIAAQGKVTDLVHHDGDLSIQINVGELRANDVKLGEIDGTPFYMNEDQYKTWKHTDLTIDAINGMGGMFSLDNGTGRRFLTKSEICLVEEDKK